MAGSRRRAACALVVLAASGRLAGAQVRFERVVLDRDVGIGYAVALADVDGDGRTDVLLVDRHEVRWYAAPAWERRVLCGRLTEQDHVCIAARAVDGIAGCEVAVGAGWNPGDTEQSGSLHWLDAAGDRDELWTPRPLPFEPTVHRMRFARGGDRRHALVVVPLHGRGNVNGEGAGLRILEYAPGDGQTALIDDTLHQAHNLDVVQLDGDPEEELVVAAREGVFRFDRAAGGGWRREALVGPAAGHADFRGASEVRVGRFANGRRYLATVEPFHGHQLVVYAEPARAGEPWSRALLDDTLAEAHAVACGDLLARGDDQIVVGWRRPDARGKVGLRLFVPRATDPPAFTASDLDDRTACEDLAVGDLDGDGRLDIAASGRDSHDLVVLFNRCPPPPPDPALARAPLDVAALDAIGPAVREAIAQRKLPGCVVAIGRSDGVHWQRSFGQRSLVPTASEMTTDTLFDLASLTKPIATATSLLLLVERGRLRLDDPLEQWLPELAPAAAGTTKVTLRHCLLHVAGFVPDNELADYEEGVETAWQRLFAQVPRTEPGAQFVYSDVGYELLGKVVERASGQDLAAFTRDHLFAPLQMDETTFLPAPVLRARAAPTDPRDGALLQGVVHDPRAHRLGGVAGHAGLFSTAADVSRYARMLLQQGELDGVRVLSPRGVALLTTAEPLPGGVRRTPGFDALSRLSTNRGELMTARAFGHGGFTGTGLWIDPGLDLFVLFLSNRLHPDGSGSVNPLIGRIGSIAAAAVGRAVREEPAPSRRAPDVRTGIDVLRAANFAPLAGRKIGLLTNRSGRASDGTTTLALLAQAPDVTLVALFSPEHGLAGGAEGAIADGVEPATGLPIRSLYGGKTLAPTTFAGIDTLVVDLQDAGVRCYTYVGTVIRAMELAAAQGVRVVVLDRPNPVGGVAVEGPLPDLGEPTLTNWHPVAFRHGMTIGEVARLVRAERRLGVELEVVPVEGWRRAALFDETGLSWIDPSPNLRGMEATLLYSGLVLFEATNVSVGRGTERPFEQIGAPWLDGRALAAALAEAGGLAGATAMPVEFTPTSSKFAGTICGGVRLQVTGRARLEPMRVGLALAVALRRLHPQDWEFAQVDALLHSKATIDALRDGKPAGEIWQLWQADADAFRRRRAEFLLYE